MTTRSKVTKTTAPVTAATPAPVAPATPATPVLFIAPPPASANIPSVPDGFVPTNGSNYRGKQPQKAELVALPLAVRDLGNFTTYASVIGATAPPLDEVLSTFDVTNQWSTMRNASSAWDAFCRDQEGIAWTVMRLLMDRLKPAFLLAVKTNPSLATRYAGLAALLGAKTVSAQKSVATRKANNLDVAEGKAPSHGQVGKARQKAAAKAALAAQNAKPAPQPIAVVGAPVAAPVASAPVEATPVVATPVVEAAPPANGASGPSGTPHS